MSTLDEFAWTNPEEPPKGWEAGVEMGLDEGTICSGPVTEAITNWDDILLLWGLDPDIFEVVEPATFKAWDMGAKDAEGAIQTKRLFSYKAVVRRRSPHAIAREVIEAWQRSLVDFFPARPPKLRGEPVTYVIAVADPQLGKKGTQEAIENWKRGVRLHVDRVQRLLNYGCYNIERIVVAFQGDEHEQVANNYPNQPYTVELNLSDQIELDFSLRVWTIEQVAALGFPMLVTSVISNHGEWTRNGSKDVVTSKADNSSTCVARLVRKLVEKTPLSDLIEWNIAEDNHDIVVELSGVPVSFSHGHIAKGRGSSSEQRTKNAIERQILGRTKELGDVRIYVVAHYHHAYFQEFEGRTLFGCPALEAERSSEYMLDQYGVWSPPGMLGFLVGDSLGSRGWSEVAVL